jgi:hypothetical protein
MTRRGFSFLLACLQRKILKALNRDNLHTFLVNSTSPAAAAASQAKVPVLWNHRTWQKQYLIENGYSRTHAHGARRWRHHPGDGEADAIRRSTGAVWGEREQHRSTCPLKSGSTRRQRMPVAPPTPQLARGALIQGNGRLTAAARRCRPGASAGPARFALCCLGVQPQPPPPTQGRVRGGEKSGDSEGSRRSTRPSSRAGRGRPPPPTPHPAVAAAAVGCAGG